MKSLFVHISQKSHENQDENTGIEVESHRIDSYANTNLSQLISFSPNQHTLIIHQLIDDKIQDCDGCQKEKKSLTRSEIPVPQQANICATNNVI